MPYRDETQFLCSDSDPNVSLVASSILYEILHRAPPEQQDHFEYRYLCQTAIYAWHCCHPRIELATSTSYPRVCRPICANNWPDCVRLPPGEHLTAFIEKVMKDSVPSGVPFDMEYAIGVLLSVFDHNGELRQPVDSGTLYEAEYDIWLSGFNTPS